MSKNRVDEFIKRPKRALWKLSLPIAIGMIVHTMYNIVDTAFVGRLGAGAIAALTFSFPLFFILISLNSGLGAGMGLLGFIMWLVTGIIAGSITGTVLEIIIGLLTGPASYGLIGVFLTIWARRFLKKKKEKEEE